MSESLLEIKNLSVDYMQHGVSHRAVREVNLNLKVGETLALVGESGCGKSTIALAIMGLLPKVESQIADGEILFEGIDLLKIRQDNWLKIRGKKIAIVFQDPFSSLNPVLTIGYQLEECVKLETGSANKDRVLNLLAQVQLNDAERIYRSYPHQISGGQRQRALIAMAIARQPALLIADEPTTALDVTVQDEIMKLLGDLKRATKMSMIFVTHNLGLVKGLADRVAVMRKGEIVENGLATQILRDPKHAYTQGLLRCMPTLHKSVGPLPTLEEFA